jgi:hypothetical protein
MTDTPTTAPPMLSRAEIEALRLWAQREGNVLVSAETMDALCDAFAALHRALADERELVGRLRDDLERLVGDTDAYACEGCGAPICPEEEAVTTADVQGCWGYVSDVQGAPCYRYRTRAGAERSWPPCDALPPPDLSSSCPRCETMRKALEPFAKLLTNHEEDGDTLPINPDQKWLQLYVPLDALRNARTLQEHSNG